MEPGTGIAVLLLVAALAQFKVAAFSFKVCKGTLRGKAHPLDENTNYQKLRDRFIGCTHVDGNIEITWIKEDNLDFSFLKDIQEVSGYILVSDVGIRRLLFPKLKTIGGRHPFKLHPWSEGYALYVRNTAMETIEIPALRVIYLGGVAFFNNTNLCYVNTIEWEGIMADKSAPIENVRSSNKCPYCHVTCKHGCWGPESSNCQMFSKSKCASQCPHRSCFGPSPRECCHTFCAAGCFGPTASECYSCTNRRDNGVCIQECPSTRKYSLATYNWATNREYAHGISCVKKCPEGLLSDNRVCVLVCPEGKTDDVNEECVPCNGACPKKCDGVEIVHSENIQSFEGCTIIEGSLTILSDTFYETEHPAMHPDELEIFSTLKEVTGFVHIQVSHPDFKNLSYFRNLEVVHGRDLTERDSAALYIVGTSLRSLNLRSLRKVVYGGVLIRDNPHLCFASEINWEQLMLSRPADVTVQGNAETEQCRREGSVCDEQCLSDVCWASGPDECFSCKSYKFKETCVPGCNEILGVYDAGNNTCEFCDEECLEGCEGPGPSNCTQCRHARDGPYCVSECPVSKYNENGVCTICHESCATGYGCTGPRNIFGPGGCNQCVNAVMNGSSVELCLMANETCPYGYYRDYGAQQGGGRMRNNNMVCKKCHPKCKTCVSFGILKSVCTCLNFTVEDRCESECPEDHYPDINSCIRCHDECKGCTGPGTAGCNTCRAFKVYLSSDQTAFDCVSACPEDKPFSIYTDGNTYEPPFCSATKSVPDANETETTPVRDISAIVGAVIGISALLTLFLVVFAYLRMRREKTKCINRTMEMKQFGRNR